MNEQIGVEDYDRDPYSRIHNQIHYMDLSDSAFRLYCTIKMYGNESHKCWVAKKKLLVTAQQSDLTYKMNMRTLVAKGMIKRISEPGKPLEIALLRPENWAIDLSNPINREWYEKNTGYKKPTRGRYKILPGGRYKKFTGGRYKILPGSHIIEKTKKENETRKIRSFCAAEKSAARPPVQPQIFEPIEKAQTPSQLVQVAESETSKQRGGLKPLEKVKDIPDTTKVWNEYVRAVENRYRTTPSRSAKVNAQLKSLIADFGLETALQMPSWYLHDNDAFVVNQAHPISLMVSRAHKYSIEMQNKRRLTRQLAKRAEIQGDLTETFQEIDRSKETGQSITQTFKDLEEQARLEQQKARELHDAAVRAMIERM